MSESDLYKLPIDELFDLLMKETRELVDLTHSPNKIDYDNKTDEVKLIQRVIVAKRAEFPPGK